MGNSNLELETAIREVGRVYDIIKQLQGLLQLKSSKGQDAIPMHELAEPLFREGLQALNSALCIMKSGASKVEAESEIVVIESGLPIHNSISSVVSYESNRTTENGSGKRRRVGENSWTNYTTMPFDDGYQWRKYGDKKISGSNFSRSYFRCTYKENQGCQAKKLVQEITSNKPDIPSFQVTYTNKHTCNFPKTISPSFTPQNSSSGSIEQDDDINQIQHLQESVPCWPQQLKPGFYLGDANLRQINTGAFMVERNCEWDMDSLLRDLVEFASDDYLLF